MSIHESPLKKTTSYVSTYTPSLLFPISRKEIRTPLNITYPLPFNGVDIWNGYEFSWLDKKGKPHVTTIEFRFPCDSEFIIESKSLKLYLNSFHQSEFDSSNDVVNLIKQDLELYTKAKVQVVMNPKEHSLIDSSLPGYCLDPLPITTNTYTINPNFLTTAPSTTEETLYTHLFMSNCPVTNQPDWATVFIAYKGLKIDREGLLKYLVSFRLENGFAEDCAERIFMDVKGRCMPEALSVYARFTRRGGLDINPFRSNIAENPENLRLIRQ